MQINDTRYRWEFRLFPGESADDFSTLHTLRPLIAPWLGSTPDADLRIIRVAEYTFRAQVADRWRGGSGGNQHGGNTFLLGDAAHRTPPFIGQGLCAGLRDAMNLSWKLAGVLGGSLPASVLDSYQTERKPHARAMIARALTIGYSMTAGGSPRSSIQRHPRCTAARSYGLAPCGADWPGSSALTSSSPPVRDWTRLWDSVIENRQAAVHYAAPGTPAADWLAGGGTQAALVRPDFTVMATGQDLAALCQVLPAFA